VSGHTEPSKPKRKEPSSDASRGIGADDSIGVDIYNTALTGDKVCPLTSGGITSTGTCPKGMTPITFEPGIASREGGHIYEGVSGTLRAHAGDNQMALAYTLQDREGKAGGGKGALIAKELSATLRAGFAQTLFQPIYSVENHPNDSRVGINEDGKVQALTSRMGTGGGNVPMVLALDRASFNQGKNAQYDFEVSDKGVNSPIVAKGPSAVCYSVDQGGGKSSVDVREDKAPTLTTTHDGAPAVAYQAYPEVGEGVVGTIDAHYSNFPGMRGGMERTMVYGNTPTRYIVRRLTPLECERLQGYPDGWTDIGEWTDSNGKKRQTSDAARYKALGNSIALPPWKWVLKRICACYERDATMASLFSGIGGFDLLWTQLNGMGSVLWESEIEDFPSAVCKRHFGDEDTGEKGDFYEFFN
jgi:DNA (cytosine-5)-methyltransferase 1